MKVAVFGRQTTIERIVDSLPGNGLEVIRAPDETEKTIVLSRIDEFDVVIVDSSSKGAETTCRCLKDFSYIPLVLVVRPRQDWRKLQAINVHGYIPEETGRNELAARLKAILRRLRPTGQAEQIMVTCVLE